MKKIISFVMMAVMLSLGAQAQHMLFKGIPMQGSVQSFASKLSAMGYKQIEKEDGIIVMEGNFAGFSKCNLALVGNEKGNIFKVVVLFPKHDKWGDAEKDYWKLRQMMIQKYGEPIADIDSFEDYYDDGLKKMKILASEAFFGSAWTVEEGAVELQITPAGVLSIQAGLCYLDGAGLKEAIQSAVDDL